MKKIALLVMGCGGVGRQLLHHIIACRPLHSKLGVRLRVVGVCDSKSMVAAPDAFTAELDDELLLQVCKVKSSGSSLQTLTNFGKCNVFSSQETAREVIDIATLLGKSTGVALVDCSASSETIGVLSQAVDLGCCVVLANKKSLASSLEYYDKLAHNLGGFDMSQRLASRSVLRYDLFLIMDELTRAIKDEVGASLPVIASINRILSSGDPIYRIVGSLSGTLGYVMSEVEGGKPFSEVVKAAKSLGYTEPDPRDDLSGTDVARKALILARLLGHRINLDTIKIESLYPVELGPDVMPVEDFLVHGLPLLDKDIQNRIDNASSNGKVLRYVCLIEDSRCEVGIQELPRDSALGRLRGSDNVLEIYSRCYKAQPLVIQGAGAGNDTTAAGVLADILDIQDLFP